MFLMAVLRGVALLPGLISGIESVFGSGNGKDKKTKVLDTAHLVIGTATALAGGNIVNEGDFHDGLSQAIDAFVKMLNASVWAKK